MFSYAEWPTAFVRVESQYENHSSTSDRSVISDKSFKMTIQIIKYLLGLVKNYNDLLSKRLKGKNEKVTTASNVL